MLWKQNQIVPSCLVFLLLGQIKVILLLACLLACLLDWLIDWLIDLTYYFSSQAYLEDPRSFTFCLMMSSVTTLACDSGVRAKIIASERAGKKRDESRPFPSLLSFFSALSSPTLHYLNPSNGLFFYYTVTQNTQIAIKKSFLKLFLPPIICCLRDVIMQFCVWYFSVSNKQLSIESKHLKYSRLTLSER